MKKISFVLFFICFSFHVNASECSYSVKSGDWVAKILRDLGSKDPFKDKSYFATISLNKDLKNIHKLKAGDRIKLPEKFLNYSARQKYCGDDNVIDVAKSKSHLGPTRTPSSYVILPTEKRKASDFVSKKNTNSLEKSSSNDDSFPILEYEAAVPKGGAK